MSVLNIMTELHFDELLKAVGQLDAGELDKLMSQVILLKAKRRSPNLSQNETELILKVNRGLATDSQKRFDELSKKRQDENLSPSEHKELLDLVEQIERLDADRIGYMAELARIRGISLSELMKQRRNFEMA